MAWQINNSYRQIFGQLITGWVFEEKNTETGLKII